MELRHIIHRRISKFLSLSDKLCTATYVGFEMNQQSFGSSMRCIATRIFFGFVGELLTASPEVVCRQIQLSGKF